MAVAACCIATLTAADPSIEKQWGRLRRRVLKPAVEKVGAGWAGFHAFRHTYASLHIERGTNIVRLSRLLGHHKPSFTLDVYAHMLDDGYGEPLKLDSELGSVLVSLDAGVGTSRPGPPGSCSRAMTAMLDVSSGLASQATTRRCRATNPNSGSTPPRLRTME